MTEIKNFFPSYPNIDDENLIINLSKLKEFNDLELEPDEIVPEISGTPLQHQELQARLISINTLYKELLLWNDLGTGKGCVLSLIEERIKNSLVDGKPRKPALIIVRNPGLADALKNEIARRCTRNLYLPKPTASEVKKADKGIPAEIKDEAKLRRMNAAIAENYEIVTFEFFSNKKFPSDTIIKRDYSNRLIMLDEAHNIREQPGKKEENTMYKNLHHFCHTVENCRIVLSTGTPIWDKVYDIASVFNVILPLDNQFPRLENFRKEFFDKAGVIKPEKAVEFSDKIRGRISRVRAMTSSAVRKEIGVTKPWVKYITIYPSAMSNFQSELAKEAAGGKIEISEEDLEKSEEEILGEKTKTSAFLSSARDADTCVYPIFDNKGNVIGGSYGTQAFRDAAIKKYKKFINEKGVRKEAGTTDIYEFNKPYYAREFGPAKGPDPYVNLRKYSSKLVAILQMLLDPKRLQEKVFILCETVTGTGGAISIALIFKLWGFKWLHSVPENPEYKKITVENPGNLAVITSVDQTINEPAQIRRMLELWNKDANVHGNYARVIIGSSTISQGHTLKATRQAHSVSPYWNLSGTDQGLGRAFRTGSFEQLPLKERYLNVYRHAGVEGYGQEAVDFPERFIPDDIVRLSPEVSSSINGLFSPDETTDIHIYKLAQNKAFLNAQIYRLMKQSAWDCALAYKRNVLVGDIDGSRECDFIECNYKCDNFEPNRTIGPNFLRKKQGKLWTYEIPEKEIEVSNYNLLYSQKTVDSYAKDIVYLFRQFFVLRFDMIANELNVSQEDEPLLLKALNKIINQKILIHNRYGFGSYLKESKGTYFLENKVVDFSNYSSSIYTIFPMIMEKSSLEDIVEVIQLQKDSQNVMDFTKNPSTLGFNKLSYRTKIILLEKVIELQHSKKENEIINLITKLMKREFFEMNDGNFVHNMYNSEYTGSGYNVMTQNLEPNGKLRVFNIKDKSWDYIDTSLKVRLKDVSVKKKEGKKEKPKFITLEEDYISQIKILSTKLVKEGLKDNPYNLYGSSDVKTGKFKIVDNRQGVARTGMACSSIHEKDLYDIFHEVGHLPFDEEIVDSIKDRKKNEIIEILKTMPKFTESPFSSDNLEEMSTKDLRKLYSLFTMKKTPLCNSIERWFRGENKEKTPYFEEF
jgi:hypothetical protein